MHFRPRLLVSRLTQVSSRHPRRQARKETAVSIQPVQCNPTPPSLSASALKISIVGQCPYILKPWVDARKSKTWKHHASERLVMLSNKWAAFDSSVCNFIVSVIFFVFVIRVFKSVPACFVIMCSVLHFHTVSDALHSFTG